MHTILIASMAVLAIAFAVAPAANVEIIRFDPLSIEMRPGEPTRALVLLEEVSDIIPRCRPKFPEF